MYGLIGRKQTLRKKRVACVATVAIMLSAVPVAANEPVRLSNSQLDAVTAGELATVVLFGVAAVGVGLLAYLGNEFVKNQELYIVPDNERTDERPGPPFGSFDHRAAQPDLRELATVGGSVSYTVVSSPASYLEILAGQIRDLALDGIRRSTSNFGPIPRSDMWY